MDLPECNDTHWKSKFIDGLPALFAERVRKALRNGKASINYDNYTYGKLIGTCMQEGLALCNEIKLNQQIKRHGLNERQQLGEFCGQFVMDIPQTKAPHRRKKKNKYYQGWKEKHLQKKARWKKEFKKRKDHVKSKNPKACYKCGRVGHFYKNCKVKEKIKNLDIDDDLKDSLYNILLNSKPEDSSFESENSEDTSSNEDLRVLENESYTSTNLDEGYTNINVLDGNNLVDLLKIIKDPELRSQIIDKVNEAPKKPEIQTAIQIQESPGPYTIS
ncbi:uncharacterized protein LOC132639475 [Lycium barbarum]|uniref:uncharacterized protein LOC132639475 n=1 Tax=Lycium barbarum TaxID=112863 RepID=UPI00293E7A25|nr:uncharacterized protein LOC132639475 [Lycium barbarum]